MVYNLYVQQMVTSSIDSTVVSFIYPLGHQYTSLLMVAPNMIKLSLIYNLKELVLSMVFALQVASLA